MDKKNVVEVIISLCEEISSRVLEIYNSNNLGVETKSDNSPVTRADKLVDSFLKDKLSALFPSFGFLSEESVDDLSRLEKEYVFIIDPIDGTKDFIAHDDQYSINVALSQNAEILLGVIYSPVTKECWYALKDEGSYYLNNGIIKTNHVSKRVENLRVITSHFHLNDFEKDMVNKYKDEFENVFPYGSSLKGCLIAMGEADLSYRFSSGTKEWDTAAMQIIVEEAGGLILKRDGTKIKYNKSDVVNHGGYVICNSYENFIKYSK